MNEAFKRVNSPLAIDFSKISFWYIRGKDNMNLKIMANKQLLSQAVQGCKYAVILIRIIRQKPLIQNLLIAIYCADWATHRGHIHIMDIALNRYCFQKWIN